MPKISRKRTRRRKRKSRGPPTRFSARLRHLPVQYTGLDFPKRTRRAKSKDAIMEAAEIILPNESKEERTVRLMDRFDAKVAKYNPGMLIRSVSTIINALGYYHEEDIGEFL